mmetsp:Transcript_5121/g.8150  ORF Transcript_5121/g.8150 Transcript_5121/m.8150 type:complete len:87 (+) Transcript_5121:826-1086(+)
MGTIAVVLTGAAGAGGASGGGTGASSDMKRPVAGRAKGAGANAEADPTRTAERRSFPYLTMVAEEEVGVEVMNEEDVGKMSILSGD